MGYCMLSSVYALFAPPVPGTGAVVPVRSTLASVVESYFVRGKDNRLLSWLWEKNTPVSDMPKRSEEPFGQKHRRFCDAYAVQMDAYRKNEGAKPKKFETLMVDVRTPESIDDIFAPIKIGDVVFEGSRTGTRTHHYIGSPEEIKGLKEVIKDRLKCSDSYAKLAHGKLHCSVKSMSMGKSQVGTTTFEIEVYSALPRSNDEEFYPPRCNGQLIVTTK